MEGLGTQQWSGLHWKAEGDNRNVLLTPAWLVARIRDEVFGGAIDLDPATTPENPVRAKRFVALPDDGVLAQWSGNVFVNPPWGRTLPLWVDKCVNADARVVLLVPARTDTRWFHDALARCDSLLLFNRRLDFQQRERVRGAFGALFASCLFAFGADLSPLSDLGRVVRPLLASSPTADPAPHATEQ